jgi:hypothetical protein
MDGHGFQAQLPGGRLAPASDEQVEGGVLRHGQRSVTSPRMGEEAAGAQAGGLVGLRRVRLVPQGKDIGADLAAHPDLAGPSGAGILLRVFCTFYGDRVVLLLSGLDKGASPKAQPRAIQAARKLLAEWRTEQAAARGKVPRR